MTLPSETGGNLPLACDEATGCQICNGSLPEEHEHVIDSQRWAVVCVCRACSEVFRRPRFR